MAVNNKMKYPDLWDQYEKLIVEQREIEAKVKPYNDKLHTILEQIEPFNSEIKKLVRTMNEIRGGRYTELLNQKAALAKAMGGRSISQPPSAEDLEATTA